MIGRRSSRYKEATRGISGIRILQPSLRAERYEKSEDLRVIGTDNVAQIELDTKTTWEVISDNGSLQGPDS